MIPSLLCTLLLAQAPPPASPQAPAPAPVPNPAAAPVPPAATPVPAPPLVKAPEPPTTPRQAPVTKVDDNGLLEHAYFGAVVPFTSGHGADALWIKAGLSLKGKRITYGAWTTKALKPGRAEKDLRRAADLARLIPDTLMPEMRTTFQGVADWELGGTGDYRFEGRVVDANVPNSASKLVFGWLGGKDNLENVTWDMKLVDVATGETVMAFHHRMVKVNTLGSLDSSLRDWATGFPKEMLPLLR